MNQKIIAVYTTDKEYAKRIINALVAKEYHKSDIMRYLTSATDIKVEFPAADVAPVRHGHWIQKGRIIAYYECSECHCSIDQEPHYN